VWNSWYFSSECLGRFNGMFAFAIWDKSRQELFLARYRYRIKPLYYTFTGQTFLFASEQKAILSLPVVKRKIDTENTYFQPMEAS